MILNRNLDFQSLINVLRHGDDTLYNIKNFENKITAIKHLAFWEGEIRAFEKFNNINILDNILSCKSLEGIMYMRKLMMSFKELTPYHISFLNKAFAVAIYKSVSSRGTSESKASRS